VQVPFITELSYLSTGTESIVIKYRILLNYSQAGPARRRTWLTPPSCVFWTANPSTQHAVNESELCMWSIHKYLYLPCFAVVLPYVWDKQREMVQIGSSVIPVWIWATIAFLGYQDTSRETDSIQLFQMHTFTFLHGMLRMGSTICVT
jgi:hypothetical protein